jgi:sporulation integral membrane protein YlbJ
VGFIIILISMPTLAIEYMSRGLRLCTASVIPTLFPFMAVSELMVRSACGALLGKRLEAPMRKLFGFSGAGAVAVLLGAVCGFPVGAATAAGLYRRGEMSKDEASRVLCMCNYPSSAFMISAVGASLWADATIGRLLYICVILAGAIWGLLHRRGGDSLTPFCPRQTRIGIAVIGESITAAAFSLLNVCAYIAFFSCVVGCLSRIFAVGGMGETAEALIYSFFELTSGAASASLVKSKALGFIITAAAGAWSGLSVHLQVISVCAAEGLNLPLRRYFGAKLLQSAIAAALAAAILFFVRIF